ncbi:glycosyltransferase family 2 protein [Halobacterium sp. MBLA0001]|uniref:glycosyltransferase family 2 protein n=1 Tax=Halobacterium sp. MBLA0001 TaxID=3413511 RepID=UPI003C73D513
MPLVSVVIPTHNRADILPRALRSVQQQSHENLDIIVVDDCSSDDTSNVVQNLADSRTRYIRHEENKGANAARNTGIKAANGDYIAFLDDDDKWLEPKIEMQLERFKLLPSSYGLVYSGRKIVEDGEVIEEYIPDKEGDIYDILLNGNIIPSESPLIREECFENVGNFDTKFQSSQDIDMWIRIAKQYEIACVPKVLAISFWGHNDRISQDYDKKYQGTMRLLKKYWWDMLKNPRAAINVIPKILFYFTMSCFERWQIHRNNILNRQ